MDDKNREFYFFAFVCNLFWRTACRELRNNYGKNICHFKKVILPREETTTSFVAIKTIKLSWISVIIDKLIV